MQSILIVGVGSIGARHVKNLLALGFRNLTICDPSQKRAAAVSQNGKLRTYTDMSTALKTEHPEIVFICTPPHLHVLHARQALHSGAHVFIEKPISHALQGIDALRRKAERKKKVVMVACNYRFHAGFQKLQALLLRRTCGVPLFARVTLGYYLPGARGGLNYKKTYAAGTKGGGVIGLIEIL